MDNQQTRKMSNILTKTNEIVDIIKFLPSLIIYFLPGFIIISIKNQRLSNDDKKEYSIILNSIIISYILVNTGKLFLSIIGNVFNIENLIQIINNDTIILSPLFVVSMLFLSVLIGCFVPMVLLSETWIKINQKIGNNKTFYSNIWDDVIELNKKGPFLRIYLPAEKIIYDGKLKSYEHNKKESYFLAICNYRSYDNEQKKILEDKREDDKSWVVLNTKDISRYELFF